MAKRKPPTIAAQIRRAVKDSGLSVNQIARESGVRQPPLHRWLAGIQADITLDTAQKLILYLEIKLK